MLHLDKASYLHFEGKENLGYLFTVVFSLCYFGEFPAGLLFGTRRYFSRAVVFMSLMVSCSLVEYGTNYW